VSQLLLQETAAAAAQLRQQMAAAGETADSFAPLNVLQIQVRRVNINTLHVGSIEVYIGPALLSELQQPECLKHNEASWVDAEGMEAALQVC
jgi:hypothetical protein